MNFLLKIVQGPNAGAEIALVGGVAVTIGKSDSCDIVLADPTMPDAPLTIEASDGGVRLDGEPMEPFHVRQFGSTAFAIGPADSAWGELVWPKEEKDEEGKGDKDESAGDEEDGKGKDEGSEAADEGHDGGEDPSHDSPPKPEDGGKGKRLVFGCLLVLLLLLLILLGLGWFFRDMLKPYVEQLLDGQSSVVEADGTKSVQSKAAIADIAAKYGLSLSDTNGVPRLSGDLKTRAERLRATAEAYDARPGVELDISDDETLRSAAEDALFMLTEGALKVESATNRVVKIAGVSRSPAALQRTLLALNSDLPKLRNVDVTGVKYGIVPRRGTNGEEHDPASSYVPSLMPDRQSAQKRSSRHTAKPSENAAALPVCGILTTPYPCLVLRDGRRILEGAPLGDGVVLKIEADAVTVTNATGRFTWKP